MNIRLLSCAEKFGGAEVYMIGLANYLENNNFRVSIVCGNLVASEIQKRFLAPSIKLIVLEEIVWRWSELPEQNISRQYLCVQNFIEKESDFIYFINLNWLNVGTGLLKAIRSLSKTCVVHLHLCPHRIFLTQEEHTLLKKSINHDHWSTVSHDNRYFLLRTLVDDLKEFSGQVAVIYNGALNISNTIRKTHEETIEIKNRLGIPVDKKVILSVGRHSTQKGFEEALVVFSKLRNLSKDIVYIWLGGGELIDLHRQMVADMGLKDEVLLYNERSDVSDFYCVSDVFYMPTKYEGFSLSMLEAGFYRIPMLINDVSSTREYIPDEINFCIVPPLDTWAHVWKIYEFINLSIPEKEHIGVVLEQQATRFSQAAMYAMMYERLMLAWGLVDEGQGKYTTRTQAIVRPDC